MPASERPSRRSWWRPTSLRVASTFPAWTTSFTIICPAPSTFTCTALAARPAYGLALALASPLSARPGAKTDRVRLGQRFYLWDRSQATAEGLSVMLVSPEELDVYKKICRALSKEVRALAVGCQFQSRQQPLTPSDRIAPPRRGGDGGARTASLNSRSNPPTMRRCASVFSWPLKSTRATTGPQRYAGVSGPLWPASPAHP